MCVSCLIVSAHAGVRGLLSATECGDAVVFCVSVSVCKFVCFRRISFPSCAGQVVLEVYRGTVEPVRGRAAPATSCECGNDVKRCACVQAGSVQEPYAENADLHEDAWTRLR